MFSAFKTPAAAVSGRRSAGKPRHDHGPEPHVRVRQEGVHAVAAYDPSSVAVPAPFVPQIAT
jgi:hypothetical protein